MKKSLPKGLSGVVDCVACQLGLSTLRIIHSWDRHDDDYTGLGTLLLSLLSSILSKSSFALLRIELTVNKAVNPFYHFQNWLLTAEMRGAMESFPTCPKFELHLGDFGRIAETAYAEISLQRYAIGCPSWIIGLSFQSSS